MAFFWLKKKNSTAPSSSRWFGGLGKHVLPSNVLLEYSQAFLPFLSRIGEDVYFRWGDRFSAVSARRCLLLCSIQSCLQLSIWFFGGSDLCLAPPERVSGRLVSSTGLSTVP